MEARGDTLTPVRVLICDDSLGFPTLVETWLRDDGRCGVGARANGGERARARAADPPPDVILLALLLPAPPAPPKLVSARGALPPPLRVLLVSSLQSDLLQEA